MSSFPEPRFTPCAECGASVAREERDEHVCELERWLDHHVDRLRAELEALEDDFGAYLQTPRGRFEAWYAERRRTG
jgi:hypothetical protein